MSMGTGLSASRVVISAEEADAVITLVEVASKGDHEVFHGVATVEVAYFRLVDAFEAVEPLVDRLLRDRVEREPTSPDEITEPEHAPVVEEGAHWLDRFRLVEETIHELEDRPNLDQAGRIRLIALETEGKALMLHMAADAAREQP